MHESNVCDIPELVCRCWARPNGWHAQCSFAKCNKWLVSCTPSLVCINNKTTDYMQWISGCTWQPGQCGDSQNQSCWNTTGNHQNTTEHHWTPHCQKCSSPHFATKWKIQTHLAQHQNQWTGTNGEKMDIVGPMDTKSKMVTSSQYAAWKKLISIKYNSQQHPLRKTLDGIFIDGLHQQSLTVTLSIISS